MPFASWPLTLRHGYPNLSILPARALAATHGSYFASVLLGENGIGIEAALAALAPRPTVQKPRVPAVLSCPTTSVALR